VDQVTQALMEQQGAKGALERRLSAAEAEAAALAMLVQRLERDKEALMEQLEEAREAQVGAAPPPPALGGGCSLPAPDHSMGVGGAGGGGKMRDG
jgi:hypothetical protein